MKGNYFEKARIIIMLTRDIYLMFLNAQITMSAVNSNNETSNPIVCPVISKSC